MVGLGHFPSVLVLATHVTGVLGRYFSEAIKIVDPEIIKTILSIGASKVKFVILGVIT